jgi:hypothetical protein
MNTAGFRFILKRHTVRAFLRMGSMAQPWLLMLLTPIAIMFGAITGVALAYLLPFYSGPPSLFAMIGAPLGLFLFLRTFGRIMFDEIDPRTERHALALAGAAGLYPKRLTRLEAMWLIQTHDPKYLSCHLERQLQSSTPTSAVTPPSRRL